MTRRRWLIVGAVTAVVVASTAGGVIVVLGRQGSTAAVQPNMQVHPLSARARAAMDALDTPSLPRPLAGSAAVAGSTYRVGGTCDDARAKYTGAGAPLPAGAKATAQTDGVVAIETPYGPSGVVFKDGEGSCYYRILSAPSVVVSGRGPLPIGYVFAKVGCFAPADQGGTEFATTAIGGKPYVIQIGPTGGTNLSETFDPSKGVTATVFQGTLAELQAIAGDPNAPPDPSAFQGRGGVYPAKVVADPDGTITATLTSGDAAGSIITVTCTSDLLSVQPQPSATPSPG